MAHSSLSPDAMNPASFTPFVPPPPVPKVDLEMPDIQLCAQRMVRRLRYVYENSDIRYALYHAKPIVPPPEARPHIRALLEQQVALRDFEDALVNAGADVDELSPTCDADIVALVTDEDKMFREYTYFTFDEPASETPANPTMVSPCALSSPAPSPLNLSLGLGTVFCPPLPPPPRATGLPSFESDPASISALEASLNAMEEDTLLLQSGPAHESALTTVRSGPPMEVEAVPSSPTEEAAANVTTQRKFKCDWCNRAFDRKHDLKRHTTRHTGVQPYECLGCGASFKRADARSNHWRKDALCSTRDEVGARAKGVPRRRRRQLKPSTTTDPVIA